MSAVARVELRALGTGCVVLVADPAMRGAVSDRVAAELDLIDRTCSRFRDDSELSAVNRAAGATVKVSAVLVDAIEVSLRAAQLTGGDLDPTIGSTVRLLGYDRDFADVERDGIAVTTIHAVRDWRRVRLDRAAPSVTVPNGVEIDLGATAKAWAADRAAAAATGLAGCGVLVSLGGDIAVAGAAPHGGWNVAIADSHADAIDPLGPRVTIHSGGLATSSTTVRRWVRGGADLHHIVDPKTSRPAREVWRTVSVAASTCVDANIASTTAIIRGEGAIAWLREIGLPARLVAGDGDVVVVNGWPEDAVAS